MPVTDDFLGRLWVPLTLGLIAIAVGLGIAISKIVVGFMLAEAIAALSITLRLTWDKRRAKLYGVLVLGVTALHIGAIAIFNPAFSRAPGAVYMLAALAEAVAMTAMIRWVTRDD